MAQSRVMVVDDEEVARKNLARLLGKEGLEVAAARDGRAALAMLKERPFDLLITDLVMETMTGLELLKLAREHDPELEVILITGYASIPTAIEAMKQGAYHYLEKPFRPEEVRHLVMRALEKRALRREVRELREQLGAGRDQPELIGRSREMVEVVKLLKQVAPADCNVLLGGESGTGKELAASTIHRHSRRAGGPFLAINCGGFSEELLANELFGHEKEAFTGAATVRPGLLESASGGTLLLDEVGDMPPAMQVKLLRAIEEQEVIRVGGNRPVSVDVRVIAATNKDLKKAVSSGRFRQDLYFRLNVVSIRMPALRERKGDIPLLAGHFLDRERRRTGREVSGFADETMALLLEYEYPGNVRELENLVERAVAMASEPVIRPRDLPPDLSEISLFSLESPTGEIRTLREMERDYIQWVLNQTGRNKSLAAKLLGIDRTSLWRHLKRHEIED